MPAVHQGSDPSGGRETVRLKSSDPVSGSAPPLYPPHHCRLLFTLTSHMGEDFGAVSKRVLCDGGVRRFGPSGPRSSLYRKDVDVSLKLLTIYDLRYISVCDIQYISSYMHEKKYLR